MATDISATLIPETHKLYKHYKSFSEAYLIGKDKYCFPKNGPDTMKKFQTFNIRDDDVFVLTFPKTGTTWLEEIVYVLLNDLNFEKINKTIRDMDIPYVDLDVWEVSMGLMDITIQMPSPRCIKLHTSLSLLPSDFSTKPKILYVSRNVKDTIISYYHFSCAMDFCSFQGSIDDFAELFMENKVPYTPYITHVKEVWEKRHLKNIYFTTYEELQKNQEKVIAEVAKFLNKSVDKDQIKMVADHCKFDNMKKNPATNKHKLDKAKTVVKDFQFMRKGKVGNWKTEMSPELIAKIDKWVIDNTKECPELRNIL